MLIIRLARVGWRNRPSFRVVLTEHTKSAKAWYTQVLWSFNPIQHEFVIKADRVEELIIKWAQLSERVAKLMFKQTNNDLYKKFFTVKNSTKSTKNPDKYN